MVNCISESSQHFWVYGGWMGLTLRRGDEYGNTRNADVYVYIRVVDSGYSDLETGQVIADFLTKKGFRP